MPYSEVFAEQIRNVLGNKQFMSEKKMFGGIAFLLKGNVLVGAWKDSLVLRLGTEAASIALRQPYVRDFDITGKPMKGWVVVTPPGLEDDDQLSEWIERAITFVGKLPPKSTTKRPRNPRRSVL